jgi:hypothetical protein
MGTLVYRMNRRASLSVGLQLDDPSLQTDHGRLGSVG